MKPELLTELFVRASSEELGIVIETNNAKALQVELCNHSKAAALWPEIMVVVPSIDNAVFLVHKSVELD